MKRNSYNTKNLDKIRIKPKRDTPVIDQVLAPQMKNFPQSQKFEFQPSYIKEFDKFWSFIKSYYEYFQDSEKKTFDQL